MVLPRGPDRVSPSRWPRRAVFGLGCVVLLLMFHAPLCRLLAGGLVVDDPVVKTDAVVFGGRNGPFVGIPLDEAAELYREDLARRVILIEDASSRLVKEGILPSLDIVVRRELPKRGVPESAITTLQVEARGERDTAAQLQGWLRDNPESTVTLLASELWSRGVMWRLRSVLAPDELARVRLHALRDERYNVNNWWRSRRGVVELTVSYIALTHSLLVEEADAPPQWDADEYERDLRSPRP